MKRLVKGYKVASKKANTAYLAVNALVNNNNAAADRQSKINNCNASLLVMTAVAKGLCLVR